MISRDSALPDQRLQESELLTRLLVEETTDYAIILLDVRGNVLSWNAGAERIKGYSADEIIGQHFSVFYTAADRARGHPQQGLDAAARDGRYAEEGWRQRKNGERFWAAVVITALTNGNGVLSGYGKVTRDLTERKLAEETLAESADRIARLVEGSGDGFILRETKSGGRILYANAAVESLVGVSAASLGHELPATGPLAVGGEIDRWVVECGSVDGEREFPVADPGRDPRHLRVRSVSMSSASPPQTALFIEDVTDRRRTESELYESRERFAQLVQSLTEAYVVFDLRSPEVLYASPSCSEVLGFSAEEFLSDVQRLVQVIVPEDLARVREEWARAREGWTRSLTSGTDVEFRITHPQDGVRWIRGRVAPIVIDGEEPDRASAVYEDISDRKRTEDALRAARSVAAEASAAKNDFLSRMSHELRTPMNAVLGFAQLLEQDDLQPQQREAVAQILRSGDHLLNLINDVLGIARIESGRRDVTPTAVRVRPLVEEAIDLVRPIANGSAVSVSVLPSDDLWVLADLQRLRQVLLNLLSNGIKYNRVGGSVTVRFTAIGEGVRIAVADTGVGIAAADLPRLFRPFDRLGLIGSSADGTGVGLAISRHLVETLNGSLAVESVPGKGSTFSVTVPIATAGLDQLETVSPGFDLAGPQAFGAPTRRLLYIEDNQSNYRLLERIVESRPAWVLTGSGTGSGGLELARRTLPHLILLDLRLPDMSGLEVLAQLRSSQETSSLPVVVITADATPAQIGRIRTEGVLDYLTKPLSVPTILALLDSLSRDP